MGTGKSICFFLFVLRERETSYPPIVTTTEDHESEREQDTCNNGGSTCGVHTAAMPRTGAVHVAELCQDRDDARRGRDGLPAGRPVLQRLGYPTVSAAYQFPRPRDTKLLEQKVSYIFSSSLGKDYIGYGDTYNFINHSKDSEGHFGIIDIDGNRMTIVNLLTNQPSGDNQEIDKLIESSKRKEQVPFSPPKLFLPSRN